MKTWNSPLSPPSVVPDTDPVQVFSAAGSVQKGPFTQGTTITIQALDESLNPTGKQYQTKTVDDAGSFSIDSKIESRYVEIIATGYYFNEIEGKVSSSTLTLRSLSDLNEEGRTNVNLLTTLESDRIRRLVSEGKSMTDARKQAEEEIFAVFNIPNAVSTVSGFDKLDITQGQDANGILLAISASLQSGRSVGELSELISKIAGEIVESGTLDSELLRSQITESSMKVNADAVRSNLEKRYTSLGISDFSIPAFEDYLDINGNGVIDKDDTWIILGDVNIYVTDTANSFEVSLQHNKDYDVSIDADWVRLTETKAYMKDATLCFSVDANETVDDRYAVIAVKDKESSRSESIYLTQKYKDALILANDFVEMDKNGGSFTIDVNHNAAVSVSCSESWIHQLETKTLSSETYSFKLDPNVEAETRKGLVVFSAGELKDTVMVYQTGGRTIILDRKDFVVPSDGGSISLSVTANIDFEATVTDADWLYMGADYVTRAVVTHNYRYDYDANTTGSERVGHIVFKDKESDYSETVTVTQKQNDVIEVENTNYVVPFEGGTVEIPISVNFRYTPSISQEGNWLKIVETRAMRNETIVLSADYNEGISPRTATLTLSSPDGVSQTFTITQRANARQVTVTVNTPGTLTQVMPEEELHKVINLKIVGTLNDDDLSVLTGGKWVPQTNLIGSAPSHYECDWVVETLDLSEMKTVSGEIGTQSKFFCCVPSLVEVKMPREVSTVGIFAFNQCPSLTTIDWGEDSQIEVIEGKLGVDALSYLNKLVISGAFRNCASLENVTIPASVRDFQAGAFSGCTSLRELSFEEGSRVKELAPSAGYEPDMLGGRKYYYMGHLTGCPSLETISLPSSLRVIKADAFVGSSFRTIVIPETVKIIPDSYLFENCYRLEDVTLPSWITEYHEGMFYGCANLNSITGPSKITKYGDYCFAGCPLKWLVLDSDIEYGAGVFSGMSVEHIDFPAGFKTVPDEMFTGCETLTSVDFNEVETIGNRAFQGCTNLKSIDLKNVKKIGGEAFASCFLESLSINSNMEIGGSAFQYNAITDVKIDCESLVIGKGIFGYQQHVIVNPTTGERKLEYYYPKITIGANVRSITGCDYDSSSHVYYGSFGNSVKEIVFEEGVRIEAFSGAASSQIKSISLPSSIKTIENKAFHDCKNLCEIDIPHGVETIGTGAFSWCTNLESVSLPDGLKSIGDDAFTECEAMFSVVLPETVENIGNSAFKNCRYIDSVVLPKSLKTLGKKVFVGCPLLNEIRIESEALEGEPLTTDTEFSSSITTVTRVEIGSNVKSLVFKNGLGECVKEIVFDPGSRIETFAAARGTAITSIVLPQSIKNIGERAFNNCSKLESAVIQGVLDTLGNHAFAGCNNLASFEMKGCETIGERAFQGTSFASLVLPSTISSLDGNAFAGASIKELTINSDLEVNYGSWGYGNHDIQTIIIGKGVKSLTGSLGSSVTKIIFEEGSVIETFTASAGTSITSIVLPASLKALKTGMFENCRNLASIVIPDGVETIEIEAFKGTAITSIVLPSSLKTIKRAAFKECSKLESVVIPEGVETIESDVFNGTAVKSIVLPSTIKKLDGRAFSKSSVEELTINSDLELSFSRWSNQVINKVIIGKGVKSLAGTLGPNTTQIIFEDGSVIENFSAAKETAISSIDLPSALKIIGNEAFRDCKNLTSIVIPENVENIDGESFRDSGLSELYVKAVEVPRLDGSAFEGCSLTKIQVPSASLASYKTTGGWKDYADIIVGD